MSEESEKKIEHFIVKKPLQPFPSQGIVEQAKQNGGLRHQHAGRGLRKMVHRYFGEAYFVVFFCDEHHRNCLQKGCLNLPKHQVLIYALPWSSLRMQAKFRATRYHGFGVRKETH